MSMILLILELSKRVAGGLRHRDGAGDPAHALRSHVWTGHGGVSANGREVPERPSGAVEIGAVDEPLWLNRMIVEAIDADQVREHGGQAGLRDEGLLESALARPRPVGSYDPDAGLPRLAAEYGFGLARNHAFLDGNKRAAFVAMLRSFRSRAASTAIPGRHAWTDERIYDPVGSSAGAST
jgi:death on curing protein